MSTKYNSPVDQLLKLGDMRGSKVWPDYLSLGIGTQQIPDLITMSLDQELNQADSESLEVWAPIHAWRLLGILKAEEAVEPLLALFENDDDWVHEELPKVFGLIGRAAIPALTKHLAKPAEDVFSQISAAASFAKIGNNNPETRTECINILTDQLRHFRDNEPDLNGFLINSLLDLKAVESAEVMEEAFSADCVEETIVGDWEDVQIDLGLRESRTTPRTYRYPFSLDPIPNPENAGLGKALLNKKAKAKSEKKRKMAKLSKKKNRRKH